MKLNKEKTRNYKKLSKTTEKLSNSTEDYIQEKKESEKIIKEYNKKIKCLLEENYGNPDCDEYVEKKQEDKVKVIQAATEQVVEDLEKNKETGFADKLKIIPYIGMNTFNGDNLDNVESDTALGVRVESSIWDRFSAGLGLMYYSTNFTHFPYRDFRSFEVDMKTLGIDLYGRFNFFKHSRFTPYLGAGVGYRRMTLNANNNTAYSLSGPGYGYGNPYSYGSPYAYGYQNQGGQATYESNHLVGSVNAGAEYSFTSAFGMFAEFGYTHGLTSFGGSDNTDQGFFFNPTENELKRLNERFAKAGVFTIIGGLTISF